MSLFPPLLHILVSCWQLVCCLSIYFYLFQVSATYHCIFNTFFCVGTLTYVGGFLHSFYSLFVVYYWFCTLVHSPLIHNACHLSWGCADQWHHVDDRLHIMSRTAVRYFLVSGSMSWRDFNVFFISNSQLTDQLSLSSQFCLSTLPSGDWWTSGSLSSEGSQD